MHINLWILFLLIFLLQSLAKTIAELNEIQGFQQELIVELPNGRLRGRDNGYYYSYESIPYAEAPIGHLRFESPKPYLQKWSKVFDATHPPVECMQWDQYMDGEDKLKGVEDCLTINIYKPKILATNTTKSFELKGKFPVLVLIHGGAFMFGSAAANGHERFMHSGRVMVVKMSYRLGPLGFLSTEDAIIAGNFGLKDQRLALQWIKDHISYFGGDSENMLALGFSSGGAAVHLQMLQRNFSNYFKAAASFSGTAFSPWAIIEKPRSRATAMAKNLNCSDWNDSQKIKDCLQSKPAEEIVRAVRHFLVFGYNPFTTFGPSIESTTGEQVFLTRFPEDYIKCGDFAQVPWLVSYVAQDGGYNAAELLQRKPRREEIIEVFNERWFDLAPYNLFYKDKMSNVEELDDYSLALKRRYLGDKEFSLETYPEVQRMYTDVLFKNGVQKTLNLHRLYGNSSIYAYVYDNPAEEGIGTTLAHRKDIKMGTVHGDDFFLIFSNAVKGIERNDERIISGKFIQMLENFVLNSDQLVYGDCKFVDNKSKEEFQLMFITKDGCTSKSVTHLPSF